MKKETTIAQIGVGYWGPNLLRNLIANEDCQVKWVSDLSEERRQFVKRLYPRVQLTDNVEQVFDDPDVDAVIIATPVATHFEMAMQALKKGKHILVEKPMAKTVAEVTAIGELAKSKNLVAMAGHTFVYNSAVRYLKKLIDSQDEVGGWPVLKSTPPPKDSDQDGMPDAWEKARGLNPNNPEDRNGDANGDGYTNLEDYLNSLCPSMGQ